MSYLKSAAASRRSSWESGVAAASHPEWAEFAAGLRHLSRQDQTVLVQIIRRVEVLQAEYGADVAEAALDQVIGYLTKGERLRLI